MEKRKYLLLLVVVLTGCASRDKKIIHSNDLAYAMKDNLEAVQSIDRGDANSARFALGEQSKHLLAQDKWTSQLWTDYEDAKDAKKEAVRQLDIRKSWWFGDRSWWWIHFLEIAIPSTIAILAIANVITGGSVFFFLSTAFSFITKKILLHPKNAKKK